MGFIDPGGSLGRRFGGIGVALNEIATRLTLRPAERFGVEGRQADRALRLVQAMSDAMGVAGAVHVQVDEAIPDHVGLGSGTQMALALGLGLSRLHDLGHGVSEIAQLTERGARSGIGIGVFEQGGFVVDGGRSRKTVIPPVIARMPVPQSWRFILVLDQAAQGLHGASELDAFKALPPFPQEQSARFCHRLLMQALPAIAENDIEAFGAVITHLQSTVGDYFAAAQGGRFSSREVAAAVEWLGCHGAVALGQSSWGPTGFCAVDGVERAQRLFHAVCRQFGGRPDLSFILASGRNQGASVDCVDRDVVSCPGGRPLTRLGL